VKFCPKCGSLMLPQKIEGRMILACSKCGHTAKAAEPEEYKLVKEFKRREEELRIIEGAPQTLPTVRTRCPKCGHDKAHWWLRQTRGVDEPSTRFFRCTKCGHTWREYT
jgi:DNA-directed RNA polymerase subunit M